MKNFKIYAARGILTFMLISIPSTLTGCGNIVDCDIKETHAHLYTNEDGYIRFLVDEHEFVDNFSRSDQYISLDEDEKKLNDYLKANDLLKISDNLEVLIEEKLLNEDYQEYRYTYTYMAAIPQVHSNGKTTTISYIYIPSTGKSWTDNAFHSNLTGEERTAHYVYQAYKVVLDEKGKYTLEASEYVDDLRDIMQEYPYIKLVHTKKINLDSQEELDYEDGPEEEHDLIEESKVTNTKSLS